MSSGGALFPDHVIMPESIWRAESWWSDQRKRQLEAINKAANAVFSYDWSDNDEDAVKALNALRDAIDSSGARS